MRETNLKHLDLNLLISLNALLEEKQVTRAAERVNLSQPAMSRALARLRDMFKDPLLVKGTGGMALTARAADLYPALQHILSDITQIVLPPSPDPLNMQGEITIATRDYELVTLLPKFISHITTHAPHLKIRIVSLQGDDLSPLENYQIDFVLSGTDSKSATLYRSIIYEEEFTCLVASNHAVIKQGMSLEKYVALKHCLITISNIGMGKVDRYLVDKGLKRNVVLRIPHFLAAAYIIANSDLIITLPRRLGELFAKHNNIVLIKPPFKLSKFNIYLYWHARNQHNPMHQWVRKIIKEFVEEKH